MSYLLISYFSCLFFLEYFSKFGSISKIVLISPSNCFSSPEFFVSCFTTHIIQSVNSSYMKILRLLHRWLIVLLQVGHSWSCLYTSTVDWVRIRCRYLCPDHVNPAEFLADLISVDYSSSESVYSSKKRIDGLVESFSQQVSPTLFATSLTGDGHYSSGMKIRSKPAVKRKIGWWRQFCLLLKRAWMQANIYMNFIDNINFTLCCRTFHYLSISLI